MYPDSVVPTKLVYGQCLAKVYPEGGGDIYGVRQMCGYGPARGATTRICVLAFFVKNLFWIWLKLAAAHFLRPPD